MINKKYLEIELCIFFLLLPLYVLVTHGYKFIQLLKVAMNDNDYKNIEDIKRILKYLSNGKLDVQAWPNVLKSKESLDKLLLEHKEYIEHMKKHH